MNSEFVSHLFLAAVLGLVLSGTNYCQEDYELGSQTTRSDTPTPTATATDDGEDDEDDDDGLATSTPTPGDDDVLGTFTPTPTETPEEAEETATPNETVEASARSIFRSLQQASATPVPEVPDTPVVGEGKKPSHVNELPSRASRAGGNWLGQLYIDEENGVDTDSDGFRDDLEESFGTDPVDSEDFPGELKTSLASRLANLDPDLDGLNEEEEQRHGTIPDAQDSDGDGISDGAEIHSGSDPLDSASRPTNDEDGDGLSLSVERELGTNPSSTDTDGDGLDDDLEIAIRLNPNSTDSDFDGVSDGVEFRLGSDPLIPETVPR